MYEEEHMRGTQLRMRLTDLSLNRQLVSYGHDPCRQCLSLFHALLEALLACYFILFYRVFIYPLCRPTSIGVSLSILPRYRISHTDMKICIHYFIHKYHL